jgi:hypothetical protein
MQPEPPQRGTIDQTRVPDESIPMSQQNSPDTVALIDNRHVACGSQRVKVKGRGNSDIEILLGETKASRVVKRIVADGTVRAVKICRHLDPVRAAKSWEAEAKILKTVNHVRLTLFQNWDIRLHAYRHQSFICSKPTLFICLWSWNIFQAVALTNIKMSSQCVQLTSIL